jgi:hypothetical protein
MTSLILLLRPVSKLSRDSVSWNGQTANKLRRSVAMWDSFNVLPATALADFKAVVYDSRRSLRHLMVPRFELPGRSPNGYLSRNVIATAHFIRVARGLYVRISSR